MMSSAESHPEDDAYGVTPPGTARLFKGGSRHEKKQEKEAYLESQVFKGSLEVRRKVALPSSGPQKRKLLEEQLGTLQKIASGEVWS